MVPHTIDWVMHLPLGQINLITEYSYILIQEVIVRDSTGGMDDAVRETLS